MQVADSVFIGDSRTARMTAGLIIDPDGVRLLLADLFAGMVHDRELVSTTQLSIAIRWFASLGSA
jgi:hypothetical protein